ncbi:MAG: phosphate acyltransferase PlsX [Candidatus Saganbacteria bacterium]|nr:phosphate acyltransferase PlsX [Candidatus Saganbacteria bacterium]
MIRIAIDAMGGDHAPEEIVKGAEQAVKESGLSLILVGDRRRVAPFVRSKNIEIVHADEVIGMNESPVIAAKQKKNSSINIALELVKNKKADAFISAGNTGALMAASLFKLGRIEGIERPAIATIFPTVQGGEVLLLDMGANVDCKPKNLQQFGQMGAQYAEHVMHIENPRVGLLNIGTELEKGNELTRESYPLLKESRINFAGYIEPNDILTGKADVIVCDGFVGNVVLKLCESTSNIIITLLKEELKKSLMSTAGALLLRPSFSNLKKRIDYDEHGAAPLLGLNGIVFKAHGRAKAKAVKNAIRVCAEAVKENIVESIMKGIA